MLCETQIVLYKYLKNDSYEKLAQGICNIQIKHFVVCNEWLCKNNCIFAINECESQCRAQLFPYTHREGMSGNGGKSLHIINLSTRWDLRGWIDHRISLCTLEKRNISCPLGNQKHFLTLSFTILTELSWVHNKASEACKLVMNALENASLSEVQLCCLIMSSVWWYFCPEGGSRMLLQNISLPHYTLSSKINLFHLIMVWFPMASGNFILQDY